MQPCRAQYPFEGDVPVLDRWSSSWLRWLRQAGATLFVIITTIIIWNEAKALGVWFIDQTKNGLMWQASQVVVEDFSREKEEPDVFFSQRNFFRSGNQRTFQWPNGLIRANYYGRCPFVISEHDGWRIGFKIAAFWLNTTKHGWCLAVVLKKNWIHFPWCYAELGERISSS